MEEIKRFETHSHTHFSNIRLIDSINTPKKLIETAYQKGYGGIAITDHEFVGNGVYILDAEKELRKEEKIPSDFKVALGNEIYLVDERDKDNVICGINTIRRKLPSRFTFLDLQNIAEDNQFVINMNNFIDDTFDASTYIRIFLIYKFGDSIGKRILFNKLDFEIHGKTSSC